jgi:hypothetical protein
MEKVIRIDMKKGRKRSAGKISKRRNRKKEDFQR